MSNFSNIGFNISSQEEFQEVLDKAYKTSKGLKVNEGVYMVYSDSSGAELWIQFNNKNECIGVNPHFKGKSKRTVCLTNEVVRTASELDGAFHGWAAPFETDTPEGEYPFVFDLPDFRTIAKIEFPKNFDIQLTAFAQDLSIFESEAEYNQSQTGEPKFAVQSFIPSGLFGSPEQNGSDGPQALGIFTGLIKQVEKKRNQLYGGEYYWLLVDTLGGEVDVVADARFFEKDPVVNGVVQGQFWLSGQLINPPEKELKENKTFFSRLFGR